MRVKFFAFALLVWSCAFAGELNYGQMFINGSVGAGKEMGVGVGYRYQQGFMGFEYGSMMQYRKGWDNIYGLFASGLLFDRNSWYLGVGYEDCNEGWDNLVSYKKAFKAFRKGESWGNGVIFIGRKLSMYSFLQLAFRKNGLRGDAKTDMPKIALTLGF